MTTKTCNKNECDRRVVARGVCRKHYNRERRSGVFTSPAVRNKGWGDTEESFWSHVQLTADIERCWNWQGMTDRDGYGRVRVNGKRAVGTHRAAWYYTHGAWPTKFVLHSCDNPPCVNPNHLREGTDQDNSDDKVSRQRQPRGETHGNARLTEAQVIEIRKKYANGGITYRTLGEMFGVSLWYIRAIVHRKNWRHIGHGTN